MTSSQLEAKRQAALAALRELGGVVVAFSGGVDSVLLLHLAADALGERCVALTAVSEILPGHIREEAEELARGFGVRHRVVESHELDRPEFARNEPDRCYICRRELFAHCFAVARELDLPAVVYGAIADDSEDRRPGMRAAREAGVRAPLREAGLTKEEVRALCRRLGLPVWDKPTEACLASRFPYGTRITRERLGRVGRAEKALRDEGFRELRVRFYGPVARIELGREEWSRLGDEDRRARIDRRIREAGFSFVCLDLEPFRSGRLDEAREREETPGGS